MREAWRVGTRLVLALTCLKCGNFLPAHVFERRVRKPGERAYLDRRCKDCRWSHLVRGDIHPERI